MKSKSQKSMPVITYGRDKAIERGTIDDYRRSIRENEECANAVAAAIKEHTEYESYAQRVDYRAALDQVLSGFTEERAALVLAHEVIPSDRCLQEPEIIDGRFSKDVREWAKNVINSYPEFSFVNLDCCCIRDTSHHVIVNAFIQDFISAQKERSRQAAADEPVNKAAGDCQQLNDSAENEDEELEM